AMTASPRRGRFATTGRPCRAPRARPRASSEASSRTGGTSPAPQAQPVEVRARGHRPQEPFEARHRREDHDEMNVVPARQSLVDTRESEPSLGWEPVDQPPHRRHADHDAEEERYGGTGETQVGPRAVHMDDDGAEGRQMDGVVGGHVETRAEGRREEPEPGHLTVAAIENRAGPEQESAEPGRPYRGVRE